VIDIFTLIARALAFAAKTKWAALRRSRPRRGQHLDKLSHT